MGNNRDCLPPNESAAVLGYLAGMDHSVLDSRYDAESLWRNLRALVVPLAAVFREREQAQQGEPPEIRALRQRAITARLDECRLIVEHYTTGAPAFLLNMEEGDAAWNNVQTGGSDG